jgi:hypothetical protein
MSEQTQSTVRVLPDPKCPVCNGTGQNGFVILQSMGGYKMPKACKCITNRIVPGIRKTNQTASVRSEADYAVICPPETRSKLLAIRDEFHRLNDLYQHHSPQAVRDRYNADVEKLRRQTEPVTVEHLDAVLLSHEPRQQDAAAKRGILAAHQEKLMEQARPIILAIYAAAKPVVQNAIAEMTAIEAELAGGRFAIQYEPSETVLALHNLLGKIGMMQKSLARPKSLPFQDPGNILFGLVDWRTPEEIAAGEKQLLDAARAVAETEIARAQTAVDAASAEVAKAKAALPAS